MTFDRVELMRLALSKGRLLTTAVKRDPKTHEPLLNEDGKQIPNPQGAYTRIANWIKEENPAEFNVSHLLIGEDSDTWYVSYYMNGMLYRIMKDGRVKMESADAKDMMQNQYDEFCKLIDMICIDELSLRFMLAVNAGCRADGIAVQGSRPMNLDDNKMYTERMVQVTGTK